MGIPLQPVNLAQFRTDPTGQMIRNANLFSQLRSQSQQRALQEAQAKAMQQKMEMAQQMMPSQISASQSRATLADAQVQQMAQKEAMLKKYPELGMGQTGQALAALDFLKQRRTPPITRMDAPVPTQQTTIPSQTAQGGLGASTAPLTAGATAATQPYGNLGESMADATDQSDAQRYAHQKISKYYHSLAPATAASIGYKFSDPAKQRMADLVMQKAFPYNWGTYQAKSQPSRNWMSMPSVFKEADLALGAGLGLSGTLANQYFASGHTPQELATAAHIPYHLVRRVYPPTTSTQSAVQKQQYRTQALEAVNNIAASWFSPYIKTVAGISPKMVYQSLTRQTKNREAIARGLAAAAVQPEISIMRQAAQGGRISVKMSDEMQKKALSNLHNYQALVDPATYRLMQKNYQTLINLSTDAAGDYLAGQPRTTTPQLGAQNVNVDAIQSSAPSPPTFNSIKEYHQWFNALSPQQQRAYSKTLEGKS